MRFLIDLLRDPSLDNINVDGQDRLTFHSKMLQRKRLLREVFSEFHHLFRMLDQRFLNATGLEVELGAGISPMRDSYPEEIGRAHV